MVEKKAVALGLVCVILAVGLMETVTILNQTEVEIQLKSEELVEIENEKSSLKIQISSLQTEADMLETEKDNLESHVSILQSEKNNFETQIAGLQSETEDLNSEVSDLESRVSSLQSEVFVLETEVSQSYNTGYAEGESDGYQIGYVEGYDQGVEDLSQTGWYLRNPTYKEATTFIKTDKTDENLYSPSYVCYDFTADFIENAEQIGYRCGFVYIEFSESAHAIACFNTTDQGLIYVEPQTDEIVSVEIGQQYLDYIVIDEGIIW